MMTPPPPPPQPSAKTTKTTGHPLGNRKAGKKPQPRHRKTHRSKTKPRTASPGPPGPSKGKVSSCLNPHQLLQKLALLRPSDTPTIHDCTGSGLYAHLLAASKDELLPDDCAAPPHVQEWARRLAAEAHAHAFDCVRKLRAWLQTAPASDSAGKLPADLKAFIADVPIHSLLGLAQSTNESERFRRIKRRSQNKRRQDISKGTEAVIKKYAQEQSAVTFMLNVAERRHDDSNAEAASSPLFRTSHLLYRHHRARSTAAKEGVTRRRTQSCPPDLLLFDNLLF